MMDTALRELLSDLETLGQENDSRETDRRKRMLNLEPETAHFISLLIRSGKYTRLLEVGTSNGYSTIWLAWAVGPQGHIISIDRDADKHALGDANLRRAGLRERVELLAGDATAIIASLPGPFDLVFFDANRHSAPEQLTLLLPKLLPGALVLADNVHSHPDEIAAYLRAIEALTDFDHLILPVGKGLSVAYRDG